MTVSAPPDPPPRTRLCSSPCFFWLLLALSTLLVFFLFLYTGYRKGQHQLDLLMESELAHLALQSDTFLAEFDQGLHDLLFFSQVEAMQLLPDMPRQQQRQRALRIGLGDLAAYRGRYTRFSLVLSDGTESFALRFGDGRKQLIPEDEPHGPLNDEFTLQVLNAKPGTVLCTLTGSPRKTASWTFRLATPVARQDGSTSGYITLDLAKGPLLETFMASWIGWHDPHDLPHEHQYILTPDYSIILPEIPANDLFRIHGLPILTQALLERHSGQVQSETGIYSYRRLLLPEQRDNPSGRHIPRTVAPISAPLQDWLMISRIPAQAVQQLTSLKSNVAWKQLGLTLLGLIPLLGTSAFYRNRTLQRQNEIDHHHRLLDRIVNLSPDILFLVDEQQRILLANHKAKTLLKAEDRTLLKRISQVEIKNHLQHCLAQDAAQRQPSHCTLEVEDESNDPLLLSCILTPIHHLDGQRQCLLIGHDITQLSRQENKILQLNRMLVTMIRIHRLIHQKANPIDLCDGICSTFVTAGGYSGARILLTEQDGTIRRHVAAAGKFHNPSGQTLASEEPACLNTLLATRTSFIRYSAEPCPHCQSCAWHDAGAIIFGAALLHQGHLYGALLVAASAELGNEQEHQHLFEDLVRDIGYALHNFQQEREKEAISRALTTKQNQLAEAQRIAKIGYWEMDVATEALSFSPESAEVVGIPNAYTVNFRQDFRKLIHPEDRQEAAGAMDQALLGGQGVDISFRLQLPGQHTKHLRLIARIIRDHAGEAQRVVGAVQDISKQVLLEDQLLVSAKMATIAGLAAGVAHELNTPVSAILQGTDMVLRRLAPQQAKYRDLGASLGLDFDALATYRSETDIDRFLKGIRESAAGAAAIIGNLLQFSRPYQVDRTWQQLDQLVERALALAATDYSVKSAVSGEGIALIRDFAPNLPPIQVVSNEIIQVVVNLLKNASHALAVHAHGPPSITLKTELSPTGVRLTVEDNGCGMDRDVRQRIFDPFFTTKEVGQGTGLGLAVCHMIIHQRHNGTIWVESEPGRGTRVIIEFPVLQPQADLADAD